MTGTGIAVMLIAAALNWFGVVNVDSDQITKIVNAAVQVGSFVLMVWGQVRRPDLKYGVIRK